MTEMSVFAKTIMEQKYSHAKEDDSKETWEEIAARVSKNVMRSVGANKDLIKKIEKLIVDKKFIPGGRYLYASGRSFHQVQNCYDGSTRVVTRFGTKSLAELAGTETVLMTSEGKWVKAPIRSFGKQELMRVTLRRAGVDKVLMATPGHSWRVAKNEDKNGRSVNKLPVMTQDLKVGAHLWSVYGYGINRTPISPAGIQHGIVYGDGNVPKDGDWGFNTANVRLCGQKDHQLLQYFSGYSVRSIEDDVEVSGLPRFYKDEPDLKHDRSYLLGWLAGYFAADGCVGSDGQVTISSTNRESLEHVRDVCYLLGIGSYGIRVSGRISNLTGDPSTLYSIALMRQHLTSDFFLMDRHRERFVGNPSIRSENAWKVVSVEKTDIVEEVFCAVVDETHEFVLEDNILTGNCLLLKAVDSREGWADLMQKSTMALMTGAGIGVDYSDVRAEGKPIRKTGGFSTGPLALMQMVNEAGRGIMQGGSRRSAIWAGLNWKHADIHKFIRMKDWSDDVRQLKDRDFNFPATMDGTNISVLLDDEFFKAFGNEKHKLHQQAHSVYWATVKQMLKTAEPGFSVDTGSNSSETLRNACCEITTSDDSDICNLGSINMAEISSLEEMKQVVGLATKFLLAGTVYSDVPYARVDQVRTKNRRLGLGLMGLHEWLLKRGKKYGIDADLEEYLKVYATSTEIAHEYAEELSLTKPVKTRAIAPTGTIGILAETTTGIEPIFCVAYKRRYLKGSVWHYQYVIDPTAKRLIENDNVRPDDIEDAYDLSKNVEKRLEFQAWVQKYVDHAISSTINIPQWGSEENNDSKVQEFGQMLMKHLPQVRGVTCYPDGARGGQPLTPMKYNTAIKHIGEIFVEQADICDISRGGTCGS